MAENAGHDDRAFCLVLHDVSPATWGCYADFVAEIDSLGPLPLTFLVIPDYHRQGSLEHDRAFVDLLGGRVARGDELVLHGYHHADPGPVPLNPQALFMRRIYTYEGEFYAIGEAEARSRLERGIALFTRMGWPLHGFVPPAWLLGDGARKALADSPFTYTSDPGHLLRLPGFVPVPAPGLVWSSRSAWRRGLSRQWNQHLLRRHCAAPLLRLGLHPVDFRHSGVRRFWIDTIRDMLATRTPTTKSTWLNRVA